MSRSCSDVHLSDRGAGPAVGGPRPAAAAGCVAGTAVRRTPPWRELHVLDEVGSTNEIVVTAARGRRAGGARRRRRVADRRPRPARTASGPPRRAPG